MELYIKKFNELTVDELYEILKLRIDVFVVEQSCPYGDIDGIDKQCYHLFLKDAGKIIAYLRLIMPHVVNEYAAIGRVLCIKRRMGYASLLLGKAIELVKAEKLSDKIYLEAQVYAKALYEKAGFICYGEEFLEDGIPHIKMLLTL